VPVAFSQPAFYAGSVFSAGISSMPAEFSQPAFHAGSIFTAGIPCRQSFRSRHFMPAAIFQPAPAGTTPAHVKQKKTLNISFDRSNRGELSM
jgi:hypothetical protein